MSSEILFFSLLLSSVFSQFSDENLCRDEYLLVVTNKTAGIEISLFPENNHLPEDSTINYDQLSLHQQFVSQECYQQQFQSRNCEIVTFTAHKPHQQIALVPLLNSLLLLDIDTGKMNIQSHKTLLTAPCNPMAVFAILESFYTVCVDPKMRRIRLYEVRVDQVNIERSYLSVELANVLLTESSELSNFVFANLSQYSEDQKIYFVSGDSLFEFTPLSFASSYIGSMGSCSPIQNLVYLGEWVLLAYCSEDSLAYFDINDETVSLVEDTRIDGQLIACSHSNFELRFYGSSDDNPYIVYHNQKETDRHIYELSGTDYHSGICFADKESTYFAFVDSQEGVFVFNLETSNLTQVSFESCQSTTCYPLLVINSTYIVIQYESNVKVIHSEGNDEIITVPYISAQLLTVGAREYHCRNTTHINQDNNDGTLKVLVIAIATVLLFLVVACTVSGCVIGYLIISKYKQRNKYPITCSELPNKSPLLKGRNKKPTSVEIVRDPTLPEYIAHLDNFSSVHEPVPGTPQSDCPQGSSSDATVVGPSEIAPGMDPIKTNT